MLGAQFPDVAAVLVDAAEDLLAFTAFPQAHWRKIWSTNPLERINGEIKRRTNVVASSPTTPRSCASSPPCSSRPTTSGPSPNAATCPRSPWPRSAVLPPRPSRRCRSPLPPDTITSSSTVTKAPTYTTQRDAISRCCRRMCSTVAAGAPAPSFDTRSSTGSSTPTTGDVDNARSAGSPLSSSSSLSPRRPASPTNRRHDQHSNHRQPTVQQTQPQSTDVRGPPKPVVVADSQVRGTYSGREVVRLRVRLMRASRIRAPRP